MAFLHACDTGRGWEGCAEFCNPDATFVAQCNQLRGVEALSVYCDWVRDLLKALPDSKYQIKSLGVDDVRNNVTIFSVLTGTNTVAFGSLPPTGRTFSADYVYALEFEDQRISHLTKIWNDPWTLQELGWE